MQFTCNFQCTPVLFSAYLTLCCHSSRSPEQAAAFQEILHESNDRKCSRNVESGCFCYNLIVYFLKCIRWCWVTAAFIVLHIPFGLFPNMQVFNCALETFKGAQPLSSRSSCTTRSVSRVVTMSSLQSAAMSWSSGSRACAHWEWRAERECFLQSLCLIVYVVPEVCANYLCYSWDSMSETTMIWPFTHIKSMLYKAKSRLQMIFISLDEARVSPSAHVSYHSCGIANSDGRSWG